MYCMHETYEANLEKKRAARLLYRSDVLHLMESQHHKLEEALHEIANVVVSLLIKSRKP